MTGSQKLAAILLVGGCILAAVGLFISIKVPEMEARARTSREKEQKRLSEVLSELDRQAKSRGLYYYVYCTAYYKGDPEKWRATATPHKPLNIYIEDGAVPYWDAGLSAFDSKEEAADALLKAMQGEPNATPLYRTRDRADCPPVSGGPINTKE